MAINFEVEESLQEEKNNDVQQGDNKSKNVKFCKIKKSPSQKWLTFFLVFSILAVIYSATYSIAGLYVLIPTIFLWVIWLIVVLFGTVCTIGAIWFNEGWSNFIAGFTAFNTNFSDFSLAISEFMYKIFPYVSLGFGLFVFLNLILSTVFYFKNKENSKGYKGKFVWAIISTIIFVIFIVLDIYVFNNI